MEAGDLLEQQVVRPVAMPPPLLDRGEVVEERGEVRVRGL
jgi:hypothetical protein